MESQPKTVDVTFEGAGGMKLSGKLLLPAGEGRFAAVLLLPGSGPTDGDGNQPGLETNVLKLIAERLAAEGVASLRFDKRAVRRYAAEWPKDLGQIGEFFSWDNHIGDGMGAWRCMSARPEVDPKQCAILGHSEGGLLALSMAAKAKPAAMVLVATPGRNLMDVIDEQIERMATIQGAPPETVKALVEENRAAERFVLEHGKAPEKISPGLAPLYNVSAVRMLQQVFALEPQKAAQKLTCPVLVVNGAKDIQISPERDAKALFAALGKRHNGKQELYVVPGASHCLKGVSSDTDPGFSGPVLPAALKKIGSWAKATLGAGG